MNTNRIPSRVLFVSASIAVAACAAFTFVAASTRTSGAVAAAQPEPRAPLTDAPLAAFRTELLDVAFASASALPLQPHARNRARAQEAVAAVCLELDQAARARSYVAEIGDWRRGAGLADLAHHCAEHGRADLALELLEQARAVVDAQVKAAGAENVTDTWQPDRIRSKIARAELALGRAGAAEPLVAGSSAPQTGRVLATEVSTLTEKEFDESATSLGRLVNTGTFDEVSGALDALVLLWTRVQTDDARRARVESILAGVWGKVPLLVGIEARFALARGALEVGDQPAARKWIMTARDFLQLAQWETEVEVGLRARIGALLHRAGDADAARKEIGAGLALFDRNHDKIVNIERAGALREVAEALHSIGDTPGALRTYRRALDEGVVNPNSRSRAEDLSATCRSMARAGVEPDAETWQHIHAIQSALGAPW